MRYTRVDFEVEKMPLIKISVVKKGLTKINAILYKFGHGLKVCSKTDAAKIEIEQTVLT